MSRTSNATARNTAALIDVSALASRLSSARLLVVDCRFDLARPDWGLAGYRDGHIPGAIHADLNQDLSGKVTAGTGRHPLPDPGAFAATLGHWGFTAEHEVVCYDQGAAAYAARLWWMLRARGHNAVRVLDGGYAAWIAAGLPVEARGRVPAPAVVAPRDFAGEVTTPEVVAGLAAGSIRLVDARGADRFAGRNETIDPVAGHVPGAVNHPFATNLGQDGRFLAPDALRAAFAPALADAAPEQLVMMCGSGVTACHNLLALWLAGVAGAQLYTGSFSEWIRDPARPVATGAASQ